MTASKPVTRKKCWPCQGKGKIEKYIDGDAGRMREVTCDACHGKGWRLY